MEKLIIRKIENGYIIKENNKEFFFEDILSVICEIAINFNPDVNVNREFDSEIYNKAKISKVIMS